jgi:hypothetical protein
MDKILWIAGTLGALLIAHFYYRLTVSKSISFFLLLDDRPLSHVNPDVRARLTVHFFGPEPAPAPTNIGDSITVERGRESIAVGELQHLQVIVTNTGSRAISFAEAPTINLPNENVILDASIIYQKPEDLGASLTRLPVVDGGAQKIQLAVPLLNKGEFFVVKFLISDNIEAHSLKLHLLSEDLPRTVKIEPLPADATKSTLEAVDWRAIWIGGLLLTISISTYFTEAALYAMRPLPSIFSVGVKQFVGHLAPIHVAFLISFLGIIVVGLLGAISLFGMGLEPFFTRRRIVLPAELRPSGLASGHKK